MRPLLLHFKLKFNLRGVFLTSSPILSCAKVVSITIPYDMIISNIMYMYHIQDSIKPKTTNIGDPTSSSSMFLVSYSYQ